MAMAVMNMVSTGGGGGFGGKLGIMPAGSRFCTYQEDPHFWVPTLKLEPHS